MKVKIVSGIVTVLTISFLVCSSALASSKKPDGVTIYLPQKCKWKAVQTTAKAEAKGTSIKVYTIYPGEPGKKDNYKKVKVRILKDGKVITKKPYYTIKEASRKPIKIKFKNKVAKKSKISVEFKGNKSNLSAFLWVKVDVE